MKCSKNIVEIKGLLDTNSEAWKNSLGCSRMDIEIP